MTRPVGKVSVAISLDKLKIQNANVFQEEAEKRARMKAEYIRRLQAADLNMAQLIDRAADLMCDLEEFRLWSAQQREQKKKEDAYIPAEMYDKNSGLRMSVVLKKSAERNKGNKGPPILDVLYAIEDADAYISKNRAATGGMGRAAKFKPLEDETIRLYETGKAAGKWKSVPEAALEITPHIVAMSKNGNGDLLPSTTKPIEWIRAYNNRKKVA